MQGLLFLKAAFLRVPLAYPLPSPGTCSGPGPWPGGAVSEGTLERVCMCRRTSSEEKGVALGAHA